MKTPEINTPNSTETNVWTENPWNLPYDLEHVNEMRAVQPEAEPTPRLQKVREELGRVATGVVRIQLAAYNKVIDGATEAASNIANTVSDNVSYEFNKALASPFQKQELNKYDTASKQFKDQAKIARKEGDYQRASNLTQHARDTDVWHKERQARSWNSWVKKREQKRRLSK